MEVEEDEMRCTLGRHALHSAGRQAERRTRRGRDRPRGRLDPHLAAGGARIVRIGGEASAVAPPGAERRIQEWNPAGERIEPDLANRAVRDERYGRYLRRYDDTADVVHQLAAAQREN